MIIPSIDLRNGQAVQLVGGEQMALQAGDPRPIAQQFNLAGEIAVVDLDAALGTGSNAALIEELCQLARCRVGGGIRDLETAERWLDRGAASLVLGTAAEPQLLGQLPKERVYAALDAKDGEVVVEGWTKRTGRGIVERIGELAPYVAGFLVTFVEREGRLAGTALERVPELVEAAGNARLTIAGGISTETEIAELDRLGADSQVGMALYTGRLTLADAIAAPLQSDRPDGLWPTLVCDEQGLALGLSYSSRESLRLAVEERRGIYQSRKRGIWRKGESSGATQELLRVEPDCDRDTIRMTVRQHAAGFCHLGTRTCFGETGGLSTLARRLARRTGEAPEGSYTARLLRDPGLLRAKLVEEAGELADATCSREIVWEAADVLYFTLVAMAREGVSLADVERELDRRARAVTRRAGDAKEVC